MASKSAALPAITPVKSIVTFVGPLRGLRQKKRICQSLPVDHGLWHQYRETIRAHDLEIAYVELESDTFVSVRIHEEHLNPGSLSAPRGTVSSALETFQAHGEVGLTPRARNEECRKKG